MVKLDIIMDKPQDWYYGGDKLSGHVSVFSYPIPSVRDVTIHLYAVIALISDKGGDYEHQLFSIKNVLSGPRVLAGAFSKLPFEFTLPNTTSIIDNEAAPPHSSVLESSQHSSLPPTLTYSHKKPGNRFRCVVEYRLETILSRHSLVTDVPENPFHKHLTIQFFPRHRTLNVNQCYEQITIPNQNDDLDSPESLCGLGQCIGKLSYLLTLGLLEVVPAADFQVTMQTPTALPTFTNPVFWLWVDHPPHIFSVKVRKITITVEETTRIKTNTHEILQASSKHILCSFSNIIIPSNQPERRQPITLKTCEDPRMTMSFCPTFNCSDVSRTYALIIDVTLQHMKRRFHFREPHLPVTLVSHRMAMDASPESHLTTPWNPAQAPRGRVNNEGADCATTYSVSEQPPPYFT